MNFRSLVEVMLSRSDGRGAMRRIVSGGSRPRAFFGPRHSPVRPVLPPPSIDDGSKTTMGELSRTQIS